MIHVKLTAEEIRAAGACYDGLARFEREIVGGVDCEWTREHTIAALAWFGADYTWAAGAGLLPDGRCCHLYGANLRGANLYGANLYGANLDGANLDGANLYGANLRGANLYGANLYGANLYGAYLDGANLDGANLDGANLDGANLDGANLYGANLYGANLYGAYLRGAYLGVSARPAWLPAEWDVRDGLTTRQLVRAGVSVHDARRVVELYNRLTEGGAS